MADGSMKYLCEVEPGDKVCVVSLSNQKQTKQPKMSSNENFNKIDSNNLDNKMNNDGQIHFEGQNFIKRAVAVGRCKIETRPMIMVEFVQVLNETTMNSCNVDSSDYGNVNNFKGQLFLQQAETVRLISPYNKFDIKEISTMNPVLNDKIELENRCWMPLAVTDAKIGDKIFILSNSQGTHIGKRINSNVVEK